MGKNEEHFLNYVRFQEKVQKCFSNLKKKKDKEIKGRNEWGWHTGSFWDVFKALFLDLVVVTQGFNLE